MTAPLHAQMLSGSCFFFNFPSYYLDLFSIAINQRDHLELGPQNKLPQIPILSDTAKTTRELFTPRFSQIVMR